MTEKNRKLLAAAWIRQIIAEMDTDLEVLLARPIEEVRAELIADGVDVDGFVERMMAKVPPEWLSEKQ